MLGEQTRTPKERVQSGALGIKGLRQSFHNFKLRYVKMTMRSYRA